MDTINSTAPTYSVVVVNGTLPTAGTTSQFLVLRGSASLIVRIRKIRLAAIHGQTGITVYGAMLFNSLSGGTPVTLTPAAHDTHNHAPTAAVTQYLTGTSPTGTNSRIIRAWDVFSTAANGNTMLTQIEEISARTEQAITLRGTNEYFALMHIGTNPTTPAITAILEWSEEDV